MKSSIQDFKPPFYVRNRHVQTIIGPLFRTSSQLPPSRQWSATNSHVTLFGNLVENPNTKHIIVVFHGLGGHIESSYVTGIAKQLMNHFSVLRVSLRGNQNNSHHTYHAGLTEDIETIVEQLRKNDYQVSLLGFSLSASTILKWLEKKRDIECAFVISPPIDLEDCVKKLDEPKNRIYQKYFMKKLSALLIEKAKHHPDFFKPFMNPTTLASIRNFDSHFTAPTHGFSSAEEYYSQSSPRNLGNIQNKVCILHSQDDPFVGYHEIQELMSKNKPNIQVCLTKFGGHVGFYGGLRTGFLADRWAEEYFIETLLRNSAESDNNIRPKEF